MAQHTRSPRLEFNFDQFLKLKLGRQYLFVIPIGLDTGREYAEVETQSRGI